MRCDDIRVSVRKEQLGFGRNACFIKVTGNDSGPINMGHCVNLVSYLYV